jgi:hypothetical protein
MMTSCEGLCCRTFHKYAGPQALRDTRSAYPSMLAGGTVFACSRFNADQTRS